MAMLVPDYEHYRTEVVRLACEEGKSNGAIGAELGFSPATIRMWLARDDYKAAVKQYYEILEEEVFRLAGVNKAKRVAKYQEILDRIDIVIKERAETYAHVSAGGKSGLLVKQHKQIGSGPNAYDVAEYVYDTALVRDILAASKQIAVEMGQWSEKSEQRINITEAVRVIKFETQTRMDQDYDAIEASFEDAS